MKNLAIYVRVVCILLCVTVFIGVCFFAASKNSSTAEKKVAAVKETEVQLTTEVTETKIEGESTTEVTEAPIERESTTAIKEDTAERELSTEMVEGATGVQPIKGSMKKGHQSHMLVHNQEEHMLYIGDKTKPAIALTFDDGPSWEPTTRILNVLQTYGVRATFFTMGYKAKTFSEQLVREQELGCEVANHSYSHPKLTAISAAKVKKQITRTSKLVGQVIGENTYLVRPPYGAYNDMVLKQINAPAILWSIDTRDWKTRDADKTVASVLGNVQDGDIILMHDVYEPTAEAVERLVPELIDRGYQLVTVPELAILKGKKLKKGKVYNRIINE